MASSQGASSRAFKVRPVTRVKEIKKPARHIPGIEKPRMKGPPIRVHGPRPFIKAPQQTDGPGNVVPAELGLATLPEWYVYWVLTRRMRMIPNVDFVFQSSLFGGRMDLGGLVTDFFLPNVFFPGLVINVQGEFWHRISTGQRAKDFDDKVRLTEQGYTVVYVLEDAVLRAPEFVVRQAVRGIQLYSDVV